MIRLVNVYVDRTIRPGASRFLYDLMKEREPEVNISHRKMPTWEEHLGFIRRRPFRAWYLIKLITVNGTSPHDAWVGYVSLTQNNEIGVVIRKAYRGKGYGPEAIRALMNLYRPNEGIPAARNGCFLANINPANEHSKYVFEKLGFRKIQETYALEEENHASEETERRA